MTVASTWEIFPDDLGPAIDFYTRVLGFDIIRDCRADPDPYAALRRGDAVIGLSPRSLTGDRRHRRPPVGVELGIEVDDLDAAYARVRTEGWRVEEPITQRPWGVRDFRILDPDAYYLCIREHEYL
ncbi:VOC family protein [Williamsia sterculiae]|uniref:VOC family protein n=1 Tax=Williamsia sterculiae TaxID=1344003 RepID=UPI00097053CB|nr:VOC family protein [Williamsia sterculiae]